MCNFAKLDSLESCPDWGIGLSSTVSLAFAKDLSTTPMPAVIPAGGVITNAAMATGVGTFTAASVGKGFITLEVDDTERDLATNFETALNGSVEGMVNLKVKNSKDALGFKKKLVPGTRVIIVLTKPSGEMIQIGYQGFGAFTGKQSDKDSSKEASITFEFMSTVEKLILPSATVIPAQA